MLCCVVANTDSIVSDCVSTLDEKSDMSAEMAASFCSLSLRMAGMLDIACREEIAEKISNTEKWAFECINRVETGRGAPNRLQFTLKRVQHLLAFLIAAENHSNVHT